jgi:hypothetical protein
MNARQRAHVQEPHPGQRVGPESPPGGRSGSAATEAADADAGPDNDTDAEPGPPMAASGLESDRFRLPGFGLGRDSAFSATPIDGKSDTACRFRASCM